MPKRTLWKLYNQPTKRVNVCFPEDQLNAIDSFVDGHPDFRGRSEFLSKAAYMVMGGDITTRRICAKCKCVVGDKHVYCSNCVAVAALRQMESNK
jgi:hypothetical protein